MAKQKKAVDNPKDRLITLEIMIPVPMWHLCKMLRVAPEKVISDFINNIGSKVTVVYQVIRQQTTEYIKAQGYGQKVYTEIEVGQMIAELGIMTGLYPPPDEMDQKAFTDYAVMRDEFLNAWTRKWQHRAIRKLSQ